MLLARRLVEVGVSFVTVYYGGWDNHTKIFETFRGEFMRKFDQGLAALINDLDRSGLLDTTLVLAFGEFGRTPKVNKDAGRDHWPGAMSVLMAGAGVPRGGIVGATDARGYYAADNVIGRRIWRRHSILKWGLIRTRFSIPIPAGPFSSSMADILSRSCSREGRSFQGRLIPHLNRALIVVSRRGQEADHSAAF